MGKLKMSETNPINLKKFANKPNIYIFGRIKLDEKEEFCEVMTGHGKSDKTILSSIPFEVGMIFEHQYGKSEVIEVLKVRKK